MEIIPNLQPIVEAVLQIVGGAALLATALGSMKYKGVTTIVKLLNVVAANWGKAKNAN